MSDSPSHTTPIIVRTLRESNCADCALNPVCLPPAVEDIHLDKLDNIIERNRPLQRVGQELRGFPRLDGQEGDDGEQLQWERSL